jgi:NAD-dependent DNA ligase
MSDMGGRRVRVHHGRSSRTVEGRIDELHLQADGVSLCLATAGSTQRFDSHEIGRIDDLDTGEVVEGEAVTTWLRDVAFDRDVENHGGVRLETALDALPVCGLGPGCAKVLASHFRTLPNLLACARRAGEQLRAAGEQISQNLRDPDGLAFVMSFPEEFGDRDLSAYLELKTPDGIGPAIASAIIDAAVAGKLDDQAVAALLGGRQVLDWQDPGPRWARRGALSGECIVFTGTLAGMARAEAKAAAEKAGATVASKVGIGTTLVVAGEKAGSKVSEARKLGIRVIGEAEFVELIGGR